ncbi:MAG: class I SAM-dependent methyltransferase, partial [Bryobacteraceae bacterium]
LTSYLIKRLRPTPGAAMISLGSGPGGIELTVAEWTPEASILCTDFNPALLDLGRQRATSQGFPVRFEQMDLNTADLPQAAFDVVFCHASLHHVIELERLADQIHQTLRPGGELVVLDVVTPSGYQMWPETRDVVRNLWRTLPKELRVNHTAYPEGPRFDEDFWEADTSKSGMECIRSGEIIQILSERFERKVFVPYYSISRRFFDTMYGPNYDLDNSLHRSIVDFIWELDRHYIRSGALKPETFFGIYTTGTR